jgi:hypothetical protein
MFVFLWLLCSMGVAFAARQNGRNPALWFALSAALSPLVGSVALILANRFGVRLALPARRDNRTR